MTASISAHAIEPVFIRGTPLQLPLKLRILIQEFTSPFEVSGLELRDHKNFQISGETLRCKTQSRKPFLLGKLSDYLESDYWICQAKNYQKPVTETLRLEARAGFISIGHSTMLRGAVELVPRGGKIALVNEVDLEEYLAGLVNKEIRSDYPQEAIKAQVIAARSYALATAADLRSNREFFDLYGSELDQMYVGSHTEDARSYRLVRQTKGMVLFHRQTVLKAFYHSSNGGYSEVPDAVWETKTRSRDQLAYINQSSPVDAKLEANRWQVKLSSKMGLRWPGIGALTEIRVLERSGGYRVKKIRVSGEIGSELWSGAEFRQKLGHRWIKSTLFGIEKTMKGWTINGRGFGHGVGLSQLGARQMAKDGKSFKEILRFYYPFASLRTLDLNPETRAPQANPARASLRVR